MAAGDCFDCPLIGCYDRSAYYRTWNYHHKKYDKRLRSGFSTLHFRRVGTVCLCSSCSNERLRINKIKECKELRNGVKSAFIDAPAGRYDSLPEFEASKNRAFNADIKFFYSCAPDYPKYHKIQVFAENEQKAKKIIESKYPNIISLDMG